MRVENYSYIYRPSCRRLVWISFSQFLTFFIPNFILHYVGGIRTSASRQAWREKIALFFLFLLSAAFFCFWLEYISSLFCDPEKSYDYEYVFSNDSKLTAINGKAVNWQRYTGAPNPMVDYVNQYPHYDLSPNFPKFMALNRTSESARYDDDHFNNCIYYQDKAPQADAWFDHLVNTQPGYKFDDDTLTYCPTPGRLNITGAPCFYGPTVDNLMNTLPIKGDIKYDSDEISKLYNSLPSPGNTTKQAFVILDGYVLDVTTYFTVATNIIPLSPTMTSRSFVADRMFLPMDLTLFLYINLGNDISTSFAGNVSGDTDLYRQCLIHMFKKGVVSSHIPDGCARINPALWATMGAGLLYFLIKMNLAYLSRVPFIQRRLFSSAPELSSLQPVTQPHIILMIPCFSESSDILKQTLDTLSRSTYDDTKKLLLFVCDGITTSALEQKETHTLLLEHLGYSCTDEPLPQLYNSLGQGKKRLNYARVYSGFYETGRNRVPYVVIVKMGQPQEAEYQKLISPPPGNRGKRDSLMLVFAFLERCMNLANNRITPLDYEIFNQCYNVLGIDPRNFKYIMVTDADIQVQNDVVQKLVSRLEGDRKMLAVSGHVRPANPEDNLTTMLQIFPVYLSFFSGLAYEACLKSVMTIQGGLVMYKIWTENIPLLEQQSDKFIKKWKLLQHTSTTKQVFDKESSKYKFDKWPKLSDEIIIVNPFNDPSPSKRSSSSDTILTSTTMTTATTSQQQQQQQQRPRSQQLLQDQASSRPEFRLSLAARVDIRACCVHPTVLRGVSTPQANTMHMQNVLLLGEEKIMPIVLLKSHPGHRLGFEPDAVGYATLPTKFFSLQGLQTRNLRAAFHNQLEMQRVSWQLGFTYWILSTTEILDMIFSMPIIIYLYGIFGRSVRSHALAYTIIAYAFTGLIVLHILFFLLRRQYRYIVWFVLYCVLSLPLFAVWFPLLAVWQSDDADYWYDVWPTKKNLQKSYFRSRSRVHGIMDTTFEKVDESTDTGEKLRHVSNDVPGENDDDSSMTVPRLRLGEYEVVEARRAEAALDSNFTGFTGFADDDQGGKHHAIPSPSTYEPNNNLISPPMAQVREGVHSTRITTNYRPPSGEYGITWRHRYPNERPAELSANPFSDPSDTNPFDEENIVKITTRNPSEESNHLPSSNNKYRFLQHRPSHSQSSYFTYGSRNSFQNDGNTPISYSTNGGIQMQDNTITDNSTLPSSLNSSGFAKIPINPDGYHHQEDVMMTELSNVNMVPLSTSREEVIQSDRASTTLSIASNTFSIIAQDNPLYDDDDNEDDERQRMRRLPRHQRLLDNMQNTHQDTIMEVPGLEEGRRTALHNFNHQHANNTPTHNISSNVNLRQQYDNHANINIYQNKPVSTPTRRLLTKNAISSSNSLSRHFRNMSDSNNSNNLILRTQPSKTNMTVITNDMSIVEIQQVIKSEIRNYLQRADLETTTKAQVKHHLIRHFGNHRIDENDEQLMDFISDCTEEITFEFLS